MTLKSGAHVRRKLTKEELALWLQVTRTVKAREGMFFEGPEEPEDAPEPETKDLDHRKPAPSPEKPSKGSFRPQTLPLAPLERRLRQRLSRGQIEVDLRIDLHGMRQDEAHSALRGFLLRAHGNEARVVLVVTGKGLGKARHDSSQGFEGGVLRRSVPHWLSAPELRHIVLGFEEASASHGGSGALYVRLRGRKRPGGSPP